MMEHYTKLMVATIVCTLVGALASATLVEAKCGAIAWNKANKGSHAHFNDKSCDHAQLVALQKCQEGTKGECKVTIVCENSCCALAVGDTGSNSAKDHTEKQARNVALENCRAKRKNCEIRQAFCNFDPKAEKAPKSTVIDDN